MSRIKWLLPPALALITAAASASLEPALVDQIKTSVDVGLKALRFQQREDGSWAGDPVATALVARALQESHRKYTEDDGPFVRRALEYLAGQAREDGAFGDPPSVGLTASAVLALRWSRNPVYQALTEKAKAFLASAAAGPLAPRELALALEALDAEDAGPAPISEEGDADPARDLIALRLLLRAGAPPDDPELQRTLAAVRSLYPSGGGEAVPADFYYLLVHTLAASGRETFTDAAGTDRPWRRELARALIDRQQLAGTWPDETDPSEAGRVLASSYAILALERLLGE